MAPKQGGRATPMMARLVRDLGLDPARARDPDLFVDMVEKTCNVFHVPEARHSPYVPDQEEFVQPYGIASVLGFGGILAPMDFYAIVIFSTTPIHRSAAGLFRAISHTVKLALQPFATGRPVLPPPPVALPLAEARVHRRDGGNGKLRAAGET